MFVRRLSVIGALLVGLAASATLAGDAQAGRGKGKQSRFVGVHPIPKGTGGGFCHIGVPHVHMYAPDLKAQYRVVGEANVFVGDPVAYGWDGDHHAYVGPHPVSWHVQLEAPPAHYCYLTGAHFHVAAPEVSAQFVHKDDAYWYVGTLPPKFTADKAVYAQMNVELQPVVYERPEVVVTAAPVGWVGVEFNPIIEAAVVVVPARADVHVTAPTARVEVVAPRVEVVAPRVDLGVHVGVGVDVSGGVGIGVGGGGRAVVRDRRPQQVVVVPTRPARGGVVVVPTKRGKGDNGWHRGHDKKGKR
jgi:hypothetical protein